jgi:hypothetical protein
MPLTELQSQCKERAKIIVCEENKMRYQANNIDEQKVRKYRLPERNNAKQCDFIVLNDEKCNVYFIELKGSDIKKAILQIYTSREYLKQALAGYTFYLRIIASKVYKADNSSDAIKFRKQNGVIATQKYMEDI